MKEGLETKYDSKGRSIYSKNKHGDVEEWKYNSKGKLSHYTETILLYSDSMNFPDKYKKIKKREHFYNYEYDSDGNVTKQIEYSYEQIF